MQRLKGAGSSQCLLCTPGGRAACVLVTVTILFLALLVAGWAGVRINRTASMPKGIWLAYPLARPPISDEIVEVCGPAIESYDTARSRGYVASGLRCAGGVAPLLKRVVAVPGDLVVMTADGVLVNGRLLPASSPRFQDSSGRPMAPAFGRYRLGEAQYWLLADHLFSFDSRYMGPIDEPQFLARLEPLWTW